MGRQFDTLHMKGTYPAVSVVMGVYNGAQHLSKTLDSILRQEGIDLEFVVVNDGSTDATAEILSAYAKADPRLRVLTQANQGLTRALIRGCLEAQGEFIARQDAGDVSEPGRLHAQLALMRKHPEAVFCSCWSRMIAMEGELVYVSMGTGRASLPLWVLDAALPTGMLDGPSTHPAVMMRRDAYMQAGGYRAPFRVGQDWDLWYRLAAVGPFVALPQALYSVQLDSNGISATRAEEQTTFSRLSLEAMRARALGGSDEAVLQRALAVPVPSRKPPAKAARARMNYFVGSNLLHNGDANAWKYIRASLRDDPLAVRCWVRAAQAAWLAVRGKRQDVQAGS